MQKVITERERYGSSARNRKAGMKIRPVDVSEDYAQPKRLSRAQLYGGRRKGFTDVLGPLRRYLRKNVGRPWNKVYSEIREHLDDRSIMGQHLFEHLSREVDLHPELDANGKVCDPGGYASRSYVENFYVHPRTGLLCRIPRRSRDRHRREVEARREVTRVRISETESYIKVAGIWYRAEFEEAVPPERHPKTGPPDWGWYVSGSRWFRQRIKRQCSEKELRANKLVNSPSVE